MVFFLFQLPSPLHKHAALRSQIAAYKLELKMQRVEAILGPGGLDATVRRMGEG
jgi:hypothetical protein